MSTLSTYVTEVRRLLHDANGRFWSTSELQDYVNDGRKRCAIDTHCLRSLETCTLTTDTETYSFAALTSKTTRAFDLLNFTVIWGNQRIPMLWMPWTEFNARLRVWTSNHSRPVCWSFQGTSLGTLYVGPVPDQDYSAEADICYVPVDLVDDTTVDELVFPYTAPVAFYAAYKAKLKEQSYGEAQNFLEQYARKAMEAINAYTRRLPNPYI